MSEYTPTTEEVRQSFVCAESSEFVATVPGKGNDAWARVPASGDVKATRVRDGNIHTEATAEFDRWLAALIREAKAEVLEEKGYFLKGHAEWTRSNFLPGPNSDACAKYNDEIGDELIEDAAELRTRAAEYREGSET